MSVGILLAISCMDGWDRFQSSCRPLFVRLSFEKKNRSHLPVFPVLSVSDWAVCQDTLLVRPLSGFSVHQQEQESEHVVRDWDHLYSDQLFLDVYDCIEGLHFTKKKYGIRQERNYVLILSPSPLLSSLKCDKMKEYQP